MPYNVKGKKKEFNGEKSHGSAHQTDRYNKWSDGEHNIIFIYQFSAVFKIFFSLLCQILIQFVWCH